MVLVGLTALRIPFALLGAAVGLVLGASACDRMTWRWLEHRAHLQAEEL